MLLFTNHIGNEIWNDRALCILNPTPQISLLNNLHEPKNNPKLMVMNAVYGKYIEALIHSISQLQQCNSSQINHNFFPLTSYFKGYIPNRSPKSAGAGFYNTCLYSWGRTSLIQIYGVKKQINPEKFRFIEMWSWVE